MKVFVTGAGALLGQGIIKSLRLAATPYEIIAADPDPRSVGLYWADKSYLIPLANDPNYLEKVTDILLRERPDAVLIGTDVELMTFAVNRQEIETTCQTRVIVSPPKVIQIADDKWLTYQFLRDNGFPYPQSALPEHLSEFLGECDFPLVVKPRVGARSAGVHLVTNESELEAALARVHNAVIQEAVATAKDEYTSGIVMSQGEPRAIVTMKRDLRDGNTYRAYVELEVDELNKQLCTIARRLGGVGSLNFQFRLLEGTPKIFEINARFSGTTPFRAYAGYNEVDVVVRHFVLGDAFPEASLRPVVVLRYWQEIIIGADQLATFTRTGYMATPTFEQQSNL
jgi:carbamoyl-phosphate synthase large subunit